MIDAISPRKMDQSTSIAVDDEKMRAEQMKTFVKGVEQIGDFAKEIKSSAKISNWRGIVWFALIFMVLMIGFFAGGGLGGLVDFEASKRSFECTGKYNDTVRTYTDAEKFVSLYGGDCVLKKKGDD